MNRNECLIEISRFLQVLKLNFVFCTHPVKFSATRLILIFQVNSDPKFFALVNWSTSELASNATHYGSMTRGRITTTWYAVIIADHKRINITMSKIDRVQYPCNRPVLLKRQTSSRDLTGYLFPIFKGNFEIRFKKKLFFFLALFTFNTNLSFTLAMTSDEHAKRGLLWFNWTNPVA